MSFAPRIAFLVFLLCPWAWAQSFDPKRLQQVVSPYLGVRYLWGGNDPAKGLDCSSFVQQVYRQFGIGLPRTSREQFAALPPVVGELQPGDLLFFSENGQTITHVGIYLWQGLMIHASGKWGQVVWEPASNYQHIYQGARRPSAIFAAQPRPSAKPPTPPAKPAAKPKPESPRLVLWARNGP